jgi:hypothetical protein
MNRRATIAFALTLWAVATVRAAPPTDAEIEKLAVGKWRHEDKGGIFNATTTYAKDGTFEGEATAGTGADAPKIRVTGKWKVSGGVLTETVETCKPPLIPTGKKFNDTVLEINDKVLRYRNDEGREETKTRVKE